MSAVSDLLDDRAYERRAAPLRAYWTHARRAKAAKLARIADKRWRFERRVFEAEVQARIEGRTFVDLTVHYWSDGYNWHQTSGGSLVRGRAC